MNIDMQTVSTTITSYAMTYGLKLVAALLIFLVGRFVARQARALLQRTLVKASVDPTLIGFLSNMTYIVLMAAVVIAVLGKLGVQTTSFLAVLGAAGLAVGLALQGSLSNFAAGVLLVLFRPFRVGDFIEAAGVAGSVRQIQLFTSVLAGPDNRKFVVPNALILGSTITNYSDIDSRRIDLVFGISYQDDIDRARTVLQQILSEETRILGEPAPVIAVDALADSSVNFVVRPWVLPADYWDVRWGLVEQVKKAFDKNGISIPFPQSDVWVKQVPAAMRG